jgi:hypothetical protein
VVVRFLCGTDPALDCSKPVRVVYSRRNGQWCEHVHVGDEAGEYPAQWCNANPELGGLSLFGGRLSFDRFGAVRRGAGQLVGQLFVP